MWQLQAYQASSSASSGTTITPGSGSITDGQGNTWTVTTGGQITENGAVQPITKGVTLLLSYNGALYQQTSQFGWFSWTNNTWVSIAGDPRPTGGTGGGGGGGRNCMMGFNSGNNGGGGSNDANNYNAALAAGTVGGMVPGQGIVNELYGNYFSNSGAVIDYDAQTWSPKGRQMLSIEIGTNGSGGAVQVNSGSLDANYLTVINQIKAAEAAGFPQPVIRLGWEMNGNWFGWGLNNGNTAADYVAAWQHVVNLFRSNGLTQVKWFWCVVDGGPDPTPMYPGDAYVDIVGGDYYLSQLGSGTANSVWPTALAGNSGDWSGLGQGSGLNWLAAFAAQHNKLIGIGESGSTDTDNGSFIDLMVAWMQSQGSRAAFWMWSPINQGSPSSPDVNFNHFYNDIHPLGPYTGTWNTY